MSAMSEASKGPVVFAPPISGDPGCYRPLISSLSRPAVALEAPGRAGERLPFRCIEALAAHLLAERVGRLDAPPVFVGWSWGGLVAFEMARQQARRGLPVEKVIIIDGWGLRQQGEPLPDLATLHASFAQDVASSVGATPSVNIDRLRASAPFKRRRLVAAALEEVGVALDPRTIEDALRVYIAHVEASFAYRPDAYHDDLVLVRASADLFATPPATAELGWRALTRRQLRLVEVPQSDHYTLLSDPAKRQWILEEIQ